MDPYTVSSHSVAGVFDQPLTDRRYHSNAQAETEQSFGVQNDNDYHQNVRRALHERSVNAQLERSVNAQYEAYALSTASAYEKIAESQPQSGPLEFPLASVPFLRGWTPALEREFRAFWHRVWRCTAFREYRTNPPKADRVAKEEDKKWTSLREEMFFRACTKFPPVGRLKDTYNSRNRRNREKQMGRNELLADIINEWLALQDPTDEANASILLPVEDRALGRKQISSHLQVLKVKFREDPWINEMYLGGIKALKGHRPQPGSARSIAQRRGLRSSNMNSKMEASRHALASHIRPLQLARPPTLPSQPVSSSAHCFLEPSDFWMYLRRPCDHKAVPGHVCASGDGCNYRRLHSFTRTQHNVRDPDTSLESGPLLAGTFPELAHGQSCPVLYASATIALPGQPIPLKGQELELSIDSTFTTAMPLDHNTSWQVRTRFFEGGKPASWFVNDEETKFVWQDVAVDRVGEHGQYTHKVPFGSSYWVGKVQKLFKWHENAEAASSRTHIGMGTAGRPISRAISCKDPREYYHSIRQDIGTTTAVQEIFARGQDECATRCCLIIYWQFKQTAYPDEVGITVFRNLHVVKQDPDITPQHQLNVHLQHGRGLTNNGNYHDSRAYGVHSSDQSSSHNLDALASLATSDGDLLSNIDWTAMDGFGIDDMSAQTLAGAEAFSTAVTMPSGAYSFPGYEAGYAVEQTYDSSMVTFHDQTSADMQSASQSSVHSPQHDMTFDAEHFAGDSSNESQLSTAASSYMSSAQFTPGSFASQQEFPHKSMVPFGHGFGVYNGQTRHGADGQGYDQPGTHKYYGGHHQHQAAGQLDIEVQHEQAQHCRSLRWTRGYQAHQPPQHMQSQLQGTPTHMFEENTSQDQHTGQTQQFGQLQLQHHDIGPARAYTQAQGQVYSQSPVHATVHGHNQYRDYDQDQSQSHEFNQTQDTADHHSQQHSFNNSPSQAYSEGEDEPSEELEDQSQTLRFDAGWSQETQQPVFSLQPHYDDHTHAGAVTANMYDANFFANSGTGSGVVWEE